MQRTKRPTLLLLGRALAEARTAYAIIGLLVFRFVWAAFGSEYEEITPLIGRNEEAELLGSLFDRVVREFKRRGVRPVGSAPRATAATSARWSRGGRSRLGRGRGPRPGGVVHGDEAAVARRARAARG